MKENKDFKILIVDDITENIQVVANILRIQGYNISYAKDGRSAITKAQTIRFDLILLDIMMPEMNGYEVCAHLKKNPETADIPIIFLTAKTETDSIVKAFNAGGVDYVTKPFNGTELLARVKTHLKIRRMQEELKDKNTELTVANKTKDKMFSVIAHDLRGPVGNIKTVLENLLESNLIEDKSDQHFLEMAFKVAGSTFSLLENLLYWARSQKGDVKSYPENILVDEIFADVLEVIGDHARVKNLQIHTDLIPESVIVADADILSIVVRNLVSNAVKFTEKGGSVTLQTSNDGDQLEISVKDTGIGMTTEEQKKIFEDNNMYTTRGTENEKGSGLGLTLCRDFVGIMGSTLQVESEKGVGTRFYFSIAKPDN